MIVWEGNRKTPGAVQIPLGRTFDVENIGLFLCTLHKKIKTVLKDKINCRRINKGKRNNTNEFSDNLFVEVSDKKST